MFDVLMARWKQGHHTMRYPDGPPPDLPARFAGRPTLDPTKCPAACGRCAAVCPTGAVEVASDGRVAQLDTGRCLFCRACETACPAGGIAFSRDYQLAASARDDLVVRDGLRQAAVALAEESRRLFGRSFKLRQVSAGGCNACEADTSVLQTLAWDLGRFGIQFVASPRHADGLLITGPVPENMRLALEKTYAAVPSPKLVIAVGACAISGGPYAGHSEVHNGAETTVPVDLFIPGCPPHPLAILHGLL
ncbi:MAG: 4Fe-4S dicluster domain-containing protein, partial [Patescibacteria group bacterium]|nr:4Fe-4S dicluster domain-containing protein [Patescibacteria group bacterium]